MKSLNLVMLPPEQEHERLWLRSVSFVKKDAKKYKILKTHKLK